MSATTTFSTGEQGDANLSREPIGYKRTEVGLIPHDWTLDAIGNVTRICVGRDVDFTRFSPESDANYCYPVYSNTVDNLGLYGYYDRPDYEGRSVTVVGRGVGLGTAFTRDGEFGAIGRLLVLFPDDRVEPGYLAAYINNYVTVFNESSGIPQLTGPGLAKYRIPLPPRSEQRGIAAALSDVDELIGALDAAVAKKRAIKLATMQQLLTGKTRLPGFSGEWRAVLLGEFASIRNEKIMRRQVNPSTPCVELEHIAHRDGRLLGLSTAGVSTSSKYQFRRGDVLFGRLRSYLRKYWHADRDGICSTEIWPLRVDNDQACTGFLRAIVETDTFINAASVSYGTHMPRADWGVIRNFEVSLPPRPEQEAIAAVLSDMDAEISALEQCRDKAKAIKQGMMQQLLTGRVRLVEPTTGRASAC